MSDSKSDWKPNGAFNSPGLGVIPNGKQGLIPEYYLRPNTYIDLFVTKLWLFSVYLALSVCNEVEIE